MKKTDQIRLNMREAHRANEEMLLNQLVQDWAPSQSQRAAACERALPFVQTLRANSAPKFTDALLAEYSLSTEEGVALMCLAESVLRVPDVATLDLLIEDKIVPADWKQHISRSKPTLVNASTRALSLTRHVLVGDQTKTNGNLIRSAIKRLGEPAIRNAVKTAVRIMGRQFVHGRTIVEALTAAASETSQGYTHSFDMLGEAAMTAEDATTYFQAYSDAIEEIATTADRGRRIHGRPGISVKLSALDPSYDQLKHDCTVQFVGGRLLSLCRQAKAAEIGLNVDAEEMHRLDLSLDIIENLIGHPDLVGWEGFGVVVQAYGKRASFVIDWLYDQAKRKRSRIMVRLVKGAYWDTEIKQAQLDGVSDFPVYTQKAHTDISYICCANKLLKMRDHIYPQFATHNAHTVASILELALPDGSYEFQRLHGMGEPLYQQIMSLPEARCRVYAPVGAHRDLLAYLVRRLLENGANSSFISQITDQNISPSQIAADPFVEFQLKCEEKPSAIASPNDLFAPSRKNSKGWDLRNTRDQKLILDMRNQFNGKVWHAFPSNAAVDTSRSTLQISNPAIPSDNVGTVARATQADTLNAISHALPWDCSVEQRAIILRKAADRFEASTGELIACLTREAGKTLNDAISEIREAVDFLRYYALEAEASGLDAPLGLIACISPWNFPLAIFTGQVAAALACGNAVLAKPAEQTPLVAEIAVDLLHRAGVPETALQLLPGDGKTVGAILTSDPRIQGVCFTGSTGTGQRISRSMAANLAPSAPLIAETGGINAAVVDSTCLLEHAVRDVIASAFHSAGQRCSALRMLYVQEEIYDPFVKMLSGAMDELIVGDPMELATDIGPLIDETAAHSISQYIEQARKSGNLVKQLSAPLAGHFVGPALLSISGIRALTSEVFGPVLHIAKFKANSLAQTIDDINASGYGLTFGIHTRIGSRAHDLARRLKAGNIYINRNQIGAVVGSQPFGGEGLSGTGPKAGGPYYLDRLCAHDLPMDATPVPSNDVSLDEVQEKIDGIGGIDGWPEQILTETEMPGPTGESNVLTTSPRGLILCLGPTAVAARAQAEQAQQSGCPTLIVAPGATEENALEGTICPTDLTLLNGISGVSYWGDVAHLRAIRRALADRKGPILPLFTGRKFASKCVSEKLICVDTTAVGGNTSLLAGDP